MRGDHILSYNGQQVNSVKQIEGSDDERQLSFPNGGCAARIPMIITVQVERGNLGTYIALARVMRSRQRSPLQRNHLFPLAELVDSARWQRP